MRILLLHTLFHPHVVGGAEVVLRSQALLLQRRGHEVAIVAIGPEPGIREENVDGLKVFRCGHGNLYFHFDSVAVRPPAWKRFLWHLKDRRNRKMRGTIGGVLERFQPDVVWCHNVAGWSISVWDEFRIRGIPIVQVLHDQYLLCPNSNMFKHGTNCLRPCVTCRALRWGHAEASAKVAAVVGVSGFVLNRLQSFGFFQGNLAKEVLYNVKDGGLPALEDTRDRGVFSFGYIGGLIPNKGVSELVTAFRSLEGDGLRLLIAGKGDNEYVRRLRESAAGDPRIEFLGFIPPSEFFPRIDLAVVPSLWQDTLPTVVFEAHSYGVPVLGSNRGGIPEMVTSNVNGELFAPEDEGDLARAMRSMVDHGEWNRSAIQQTARKFYDSESWLERFEAISSKAMLGAG